MKKLNGARNVKRENERDQKCEIERMKIEK